METAKILVVDDEPSILRLLQEALTQWGYSVKCASSGTEAVDAVRGEMFDAVITDIRMPEMSGLELLTRLSPRALQAAFGAAVGPSRRARFARQRLALRRRRGPLLDAFNQLVK